MPNHEELITSRSFDEKFKRALLNYYSYGFKNLHSFDKAKHKAMSDDWLRLSNVLSGYMEWSENRNEVMFASVDSQSMEENPFHRIYRFCKYPLTYPAYFLHTMAALSDQFCLRGGVDALELAEDRRIHLEDVLESGAKLKTADLIYFYPENLVSTEGDDKNKTPNNRLKDLLAFGVVACEQNKGKRGGRGDRRWSLPDLTMKKILDSGNNIQEDFERRFRSALDFFSKYFLFGEVGTFLLDRFSGSAVSPFRMKHEYFMQSLNDFNLLDLLFAIENGNWCKIKYRHGTAGFETELLCYPLEIRVSNMQGREYLMYYEPFHRSYTALRVEFIDAIEFYEDSRIKTILIQNGYHISPESVDADIANARQSLRYSWGVSATKETENNAVTPAELHSVSLQIAYDPDKEYYIANRLRRERRFGVVSEPDGRPYLRFSVEVSDEGELRPWMRSFYSRIMACDGMESDGFSLENDVKTIVERLLREEHTPPQSGATPPVNDRWRIPEHITKALGNGRKAREHDLLFNEIFSVYYYVIADVFVQLSSGADDQVYTKDEFDKIITRSIRKYYSRIGEETRKLLSSEIRELLFSGGFLKETKKTLDGENPNGTGFHHKPEEVTAYLPKYKCDPGAELYRDVVPISTIELRWLKTILNDADHKMKLFLSDAEIAMLNDLLNQCAPSVSPFPMDKIVFFDRFHFPEKKAKREAAVLATLVECNRSQRTVYIKYHTRKHQVKTGTYRPIVLEFSKRNNRFQGFLQECGSDHIYTMNLSQIESAVETEASFDYATAEQALDSYRKDNTTSVQVAFYDTRNIVDRILTEFSPWEKRCSYDPETGLYQLTIFYQKSDEVDLVVRLMGYGGDLYMVDLNHPIGREIQFRMDRQMELIRQRRSARSDREPGDIR